MENLSLFISAALVPIVWAYVIKPTAAWVVDRIPPGPIKDMLTKDRGGAV
jgi:hypothetical protein